MEKTVRYGSKKTIADYDVAIAVLEEELAAHRKTKQDYDLNSSDSYETGVYDEEERRLMLAIATAKSERASIVIINEENKDEAVVNFEDIVEVEMECGGEARVEKFVITGGLPNISENKISINSPMGKAIFGKKVGDTVSYTVGKNTFNVRIISKEGVPVKTPNQPGNGN